VDTQQQQQIYGYRQLLFIRYTLATLIDMVVLGLFAQYWSRVEISSFSYLLLSAIALQVMLKVALSVEAYIAEYIDKKGFKHAKTIRLVSAWLLLLVSKLLILGALEYFFSGNIYFVGKWHGVVPFLIVIFVMLGAEAAVRWIYQWLGGVDLLGLDKTNTDTGSKSSSDSSELK